MATYRRSTFGQRKFPMASMNGARTASSAHAGSSSRRVLHHEAFEGSQRKKRQIHVLTDLNNEEEEILVDWIRENECIYNRKLADNKNLRKKENLWADKAEEMGKTADILNVWYRSIRTRYVKLIKKKRLGAEMDEFSERDVWIMEKFSFLAKHIGKMKKARTVKRNIASVSGEAGPSSAAAPQESDNDDGWLGGSMDLPLPPSPSPRGDSKHRVARTSVVGEDAALTLGTAPRSEHSLLLQMQERMLTMLQPRVTNERTAYTDWLRTVIEGFEPSIWRDFHFECSQLIYKYQLQNDQVLSGQTTQQSTSNAAVDSLMEGVNSH